MLKIILYAILAMIVVGLLVGSVHLYKVAVKNKKEMSQYSGEEIAYRNKLGKILVVYYSLSGNTKAIAEKIALETGADIFELKTQTPINVNPLFYTTVKKQLKTREYPKLENNFPNAAAYDMIIVGSPIWWYTAATPVLEFLKEYDFKGKKVVPFSTQGSNYGTYFEDFAKKARNAKVLDGASFNNLPKEYNQAIDNKINKWLNSLKK